MDTHLSSADLMAGLIRILEEMTSDWELDFTGGIGPDTRLIGDLEFESIDVVQLVVAVEEGFGRRGFPFEQLLMAEGRYVDDLAVGEVAAFLEHQLND